MSEEQKNNLLPNYGKTAKELAQQELNKTLVKMQKIFEETLAYITLKTHKNLSDVSWKETVTILKIGDEQNKEEPLVIQADKILEDALASSLDAVEKALESVGENSQGGLAAFITEAKEKLQKERYIGSIMVGRVSDPHHKSSYL